MPARCYHCGCNPEGPAVKREGQTPYPCITWTGKEGAVHRIMKTRTVYGDPSYMLFENGRYQGGYTALDGSMFDHIPLADKIWIYGV